MRVIINEAVCEGCGDCGAKSNCLSVQPIDTEFGRKTHIHQSSCNKDYSCLNGDCPSFVTVNLVNGGTERPKPVLPEIASILQEPIHKVSSADGYAIYMAGIGGTGVVTVNTLLGTAGMLEGKYRRPIKWEQERPICTWDSTSWWRPNRFISKKPVQTAREL